jgi:multidrug efflux system membrane fusion protein
MNQTDRQEPSLETAPGQRKKRHLLAWLLMLMICGVLLLPMMHRVKAVEFNGPPGPGGPGPGAGGTEVNVATASTGSMDIYLDALGTITPQNTVNVYSLESGRVLSVNYREGQMVQRGQLLAEIDPQPLEAQLQQAAGSLKRDQASLDQARVDLERYKDALAQNALPQQTVYDQQQAVKQYEGAVENDQGTVNYDKVQLAYCHITAPISGRVGLRLIDPGNIVFSGSSSTIAVITQLNPITAVFSIPEDRVRQVQKQSARGASLKVDLYDRAQAQQLASGTLLTLDNAVDTTTGTVKLRALFTNSDGSLFPNQFVNARLRVDTLNSAILIPTVAIQYNGQQAFVYRIKPDQTAAIQNVTVVNSEQSQSAVQGLSEGDQVVTTNFDRVQDGAPVVIAGARSMPGAPAKPANGR